MKRSIFATAFSLAGGLWLGACANVLSQFEPSRETVCLQAARISLRDAVLSAESHGGRAIEAHYHQDRELGCLGNNPGHYDVTLAMEGGATSVGIDARSGETVSTHEQPNGGDGIGRAFWSIFGRNPAERVRDASMIALGLPDAVALAERADGKVLKVSIENRANLPGYAVKLAGHGRVRTIWVDGHSDSTRLARAYEPDPEFESEDPAGYAAVAFLDEEDADEEGTDDGDAGETEG